MNLGFWLLVPGLRPLESDTEVGGSLRPAVACLRGLIKLWSMIQEQPFIWKSSMGKPASWVGWHLWGQIVIARLMKSQIWHQLAHSVAVGGGGLRKGTMASAHLDTRHFNFFQYATGAFQAATPELALRGSEFE